MKIKGKITFTDGDAKLFDDLTQIHFLTQAGSVAFNGSHGPVNETYSYKRVRSFEFIGENVPDKLVEDVLGDVVSNMIGDMADGSK